MNHMTLFSDYLHVTGVAHTDPVPTGDSALMGKRLGILNGSSWITLWANYFGRQYLPGVHLVNIGNEAIQINFMEAHDAGKPTPPQSNIEAFTRYARDLVELARVNAVLITCSTMNRAYPAVQQALAPLGVPVIQIDQPMMQQAIKHGGRVLVVATHGPTVISTQVLLRETAEGMGKTVDFDGLDVPAAWNSLEEGDVEGHNTALANSIRARLNVDSSLRCVVLAQLSMTAFLLSYPDPEAAFGVPVFTSGQCGFERVREVLTNASPS